MVHFPFASFVLSLLLRETFLQIGEPLGCCKNHPVLFVEAHRSRHHPRGFGCAAVHEVLEEAVHVKRSCCCMLLLSPSLFFSYCVSLHLGWGGGVGWGNNVIVLYVMFSCPQHTYVVLYDTSCSLSLNLHISRRAMSYSLVLDMK